jgi:hypothetical protein
MDLDSKLIFESYSSRELLTEEERSLLTEEEESWWQFALKVVDPTGVTSYGDLSRAYDNYNKDQSTINFALLLLGVFNALPNFGLLAAGWGGIGWAALKGALKASVSKSPQAAVSAANRLLSMASKTPGITKAFTSGVDNLVTKGVIDQRTASLLTTSMKRGQLFSPATNQAMVGAAGKGGEAVRGAAAQAIAKSWREGGLGVGLGGKWKALSRASSSFGPSGTGVEYPDWAPKTLFGKLLPGSDEQGASESARRLAAARARLEELRGQLS